MRGRRLVIVIAAWGCVSPAEAVINPELTPVQLVRQAEQVWLLTLQSSDRPDRLAVRIDKPLFGAAPERRPIIDLSLLTQEARATFVESARDRTAVWFVTRLADTPNAAANKVGLLHVAGRWHRLIGRTPLVWQLERVDRSLDGTWNGGTQMLARAVEYVLADPNAVIPAMCDAAWGSARVIAQVSGDVRGLLPIDLGHGPSLLVQSDVGNRLLEFSPATKTLNDVTKERDIDLHSFSTWSSVTADFDGDSLADVVQISTEGATLRRGQATGLLPPAMIDGVKPRGEPRTLALSDFDADGKLDLLVVATDSCSLWTNTGEGTFSETFTETGELAALAGATPAGVQSCDINNDGRQDLLVWYKDRAPQLYFNRGFRCFGLATTLALDKHAQLSGQQTIQAAAVADLDGDGCQDLAILKADGSLVLVPRDPSKGNKLGLTVSLPPDRAGPVTVSVLDGKRSLGAQVVLPGQPAFFGKTNKGPLMLSWRLPGQQPKAQPVIILKPMRVSLNGP